MYRLKYIFTILHTHFQHIWPNTVPFISLHLISQMLSEFLECSEQEQKQCLEWPEQAGC